MSPKEITILTFSFILTSCNSPSSEMDIQGHRGCRGHFPENSIEGFFAALEMGATTLELDVVISQDGQVVISHEPWINPNICLSPDGDSLKTDDRFNIYRMPYQEIRRYDCGSLTPGHFLKQKSMATYKPLLSELMDSLIVYANNRGIPLIPINVETKSRPEWDNQIHPVPEEFVQLVLELTRSKNYLSATTIQSFDIRTLVETRKQEPTLPIALLVNESENIANKISELGLDPDIISPHHRLVTKELVEHYKAKGIKLIPWTVNAEEDIIKMLAFRVDGIISDYPDRVAKLVQ